MKGIYIRPIIDIAIKSEQGSLESLAAKLTMLEYIYRGQFDDEPGHYYAVLDKHGKRLYQLHIYTRFRPDLACKLTFKEQLIADKVLTKEYSDDKYNLSKGVLSKHKYANFKDKCVYKKISACSD